MNEPRTRARGMCARGGWSWRTVLAALASIASTACGSAAEPQSGSTNWLRCSTLSDCDTPLAVSCSSQGYCLDAEGERISSGDDPGTDVPGDDAGDAPRADDPADDTGDAGSDPTEVAADAGVASPAATYTSRRDFEAAPSSLPAEFCPGSGVQRAFPRWVAGGDVVLGPEGIGVSLFDVGDPTEPARLGSAELGGDLWGLWVIASEGTQLRSVAALVSTSPAPPSALPPVKADLQTGVQLLALDVSDPENPSVVARFDPQGDVLDLRVARGALWIVSAVPEPPREECPEEPACTFYSKLVLTSYSLTSGDYEPLTTLELPPAFSTWLSDVGLVLFASGDDINGTLHVVRFGDEGLTEGDVSLGASSRPESVQWAADELRVVTAIDRGLVLTRYTTEPAAELDTTTIGTSTLNDLEANFAGDWLSVNATTADGPPKLWHLGQDVEEVTLPDGLLRLFSLPESFGAAAATDADAGAPGAGGGLEPALGSALGIALSGDSSTPDALELVALNPTGIEVLDVWEPEDPAVLMGFSGRDAFERSGSSLVTKTYPSAGRQFTVLHVQDEKLIPIEKIVGGDSNESLLVGSALVMPNAPGLRIVDTETSEGGELSVEPWPAIRVSSGPWSGALFELPSRQYEFRVAAENADAQDAESEATFTATIAGADLSILPIDGGFILPATGAEACDSRHDHCEPHTPLLSIVSGGPTFQLLEVPLPENRLEAPTPDDVVEFTWTGLDVPPVQLSDGRWVFVAVLARECHGVDACAQLGTEPVFVDDEWRGRLVQRLHYVLNLPEGAAPYFGEPVISTPSSPNGGFYPPIARGDGLLVTRAESTGDDSSVEQVFVEYFEPDLDGGLQLQLVANVPGRPADLGALREADAASSLYVVEPNAGGAATLHRLQLQGNAAAVSESLTLPGYHLALAGAGDFGLQLASVGDSCTYEVELTTFALEPSLEIKGSVSLGTAVGVWAIVATRDSRVLLEAGYSSGHYLIVDVAADGSPSLVAFQSSACRPGTDEIRFDQAEVSCD